jgi:hypothetical protein
MNPDTSNYQASVMSDDNTDLITVDLRDLPIRRIKQLKAEAQLVGDDALENVCKSIISGSNR